MNDIAHLDKFEESINKKLYKYLLDKDQVDKMLPDTPDIDDKWEQICMAYLHDGVREFSDYPVVSLGWMMFMGMAVAKMWDEDWEKHSVSEDLYTPIRDVRGYDNMDDYICEDILKLTPEETEKTSDLVRDCATMVHNALMHEGFEHGTPTAFNAYVRCLHQLYYFGAAIELKRLGYHMTKTPLDELFDPLNLN